jgi:hypothetical protein
VAEHVFQHDGAPLNRGKRDENRQCDFDAHGIRALILGLADVRNIGHDVDVLPLVATQKIHGRIMRNAKQPRPKRRRPVHLTEREVRLGECVLHDILAIKDVARHARAVAMQLGSNVGDELHEACPRLDVSHPDCPSSY